MLKSIPHGAENGGVAFSALYEQCLPGVYQYISCRLSNNQLAEELTLASLKKAVLRNLVDNIEPHDYLIAVFTIARNEVCNYLRTNKSKPAWPVLSNQEQDVIALKLGASLDNRSISSILGLSESSVTSTVAKSLCKLRDCPEIKQPPHN